MTNPSTKVSATSTKQVQVDYLGLRFLTDHYYLKRGNVVEKILFRNRTFYAKFERIDEAPTALLMQQHQHTQYTVALPLLHDGKTHYLVFDYDGSDPVRFIHLTHYLMQREGITDYKLFRGKDARRIQLFIETEPMTLEAAHEKLEKLSALFASKMPKEWKTLPSAALPEAYNIVTLPYETVAF